MSNKFLEEYEKVMNYGKEQVSEETAKLVDLIKLAKKEGKGMINGKKYSKQQLDELMKIYDLAESFGLDYEFNKLSVEQAYKFVENIQKMLKKGI